MTFHAYARAHRLATAFTKDQDLQQAVFGPADRSLPEATMQSPAIKVSNIETPVGTMVAGATAGGICLLEFADRWILEKQMATLRSWFRVPAVPGTNSAIDLLGSELQEYFEGKRTSFTVPLDIRGTAFQERVWRLLCGIPYGGTWSYEELAGRAGNTAAVRAVARANAMNRIAILIPCHRVVNKNGELGGYGGGLWRKAALLELEAASNRLQVCAQSA
jgi:AraC family transcriptional regulator of adaptative response/methylated-DNA-[protein]-cysteine methyltransferase